MHLYPIPDFEGYEITRDGHVFSWRRYKDGHWLTPHSDPKGYLRVTMRRNGKKTIQAVHTLMALTFIGPKPFPRAEVRHLDSQNTHNVPENLAWGTSKENSADRDAAGHHWKKRRTHCSEGHEYTPENTKVFPSAPNDRVCIACRRKGDRERSRRYRAAQ